MSSNCLPFCHSLNTSKVHFQKGVRAYIKCWLPKPDCSCCCNLEFYNAWKIMHRFAYCMETRTEVPKIKCFTDLTIIIAKLSPMRISWIIFNIVCNYSEIFFLHNWQEFAFSTSFIQLKLIDAYFAKTNLPKIFSIYTYLHIFYVNLLAVVLTWHHKELLCMWTTKPCRDQF